MIILIRGPKSLIYETFSDHGWVPLSPGLWLQPMTELNNKKDNYLVYNIDSTSLFL